MSIIIKGMDPPRFCSECPLKQPYANTEHFICLPRHAFIHVNLDTGRDNECPIRPAKSVSCQVRVANEMASLMPKEVIESYVRDGITHNLAEFMFREDVLNIQKKENPELQERIYSVTMDIETKRKSTVRGPAKGGGEDG